MPIKEIRSVRVDHLGGLTMQEREKSQAASYGGLRCSHLLQWIYVLALTGLTLYQFVELQNVKEEVAILKEVRRCGFFCRGL